MRESVEAWECEERREIQTPARAACFLETLVIWRTHLRRLCNRLKPMVIRQPMRAMTPPLHPDLSRAVRRLPWLVRATIAVSTYNPLTFRYVPFVYFLRCCRAAMMSSRARSCLDVSSDHWSFLINGNICPTIPLMDCIRWYWTANYLESLYLEISLWKIAMNLKDSW